MTDRVKFAYLTYEDMLSKLDTGELNEYDICFSKDRSVIYLITEELQPLELRSKVYVFDSVSEAETKLNEAIDTYIGQVVAILNDGIYRGYIVNKENDIFTTTPLWEHPKPIDYDTLGNRPIINLVGTLDEPIMVSELDNGIYRIKGQYKISSLEDTIYLSASDIICTVAKDTKGITVKRITSDDITDYFITSSDISKNSYITNQYLKDNNYTTTSYVDTKIEALELSIKEDMKTYVQGIIEDVFGESLDEIIDNRISENIQSMDSTQIQNLF